jgi:hypothetical protein
MRSKKILISCAGLGMGNASRVSAIAQELLDTDVQLTIASWGAGFLFLQEFKKNQNLRFELIELKSYGGSLARSMKSFMTNCLRLRRLVSKFQPDAILLDSDYHVLAYLGSSAPRYFLGQADEIVSLSQQIRLPTLRMRVDFVMRETLDRLFQKTICAKVFCPSFESAGDSSGKIEKIPLVVRREFLQTEKSQAKSERVGILPGGSGWDADKLSLLQAKYPLSEWVHPDRRIQITRSSDLAPYEVIVCQGGMSSISECLALNKFMLIVPIQNQAEQFITAAALEKKGLALMVDSRQPSSPDLLTTALARPKPRLASVNCQGAAVVAKRLLDAVCV